MEEIYTYVAREIKRMDYAELPGGFVLTGGCMSMPYTELAQDLYNGQEWQYLIILSARATIHFRCRYFEICLF